MIVKHVVLLSTICMVALLAINTVNAISYEGILALDPISSKVVAGDTVVFSGQLYTTSGHVVPNAVIYIMDDVSFGRDKVITQAITDDNGEFYITWTAKQRSSGAWDIYAVFDGSSNVSQARSDEYKVRVSSSHSSKHSDSSGSSSSFQKYSTSITLHKIPSSIYAGDSVTFTGRLTSNGSPLENVLIKILEDDPALPDELLGRGQTNSNGEFSISWSVSVAEIEKDFDVYAVFDGSKSYSRDRTYNQVMTVLKHGGSITLDKFSQRANIGDPITFSGVLKLDKYSTTGAVVYIKDEDPLTRDELLATAYVDQYGAFSTTWIAERVDRDYTVDIYAVYEGNDLQYKITTCDKNPSKLLKTCPNTIPLKLSSNPTSLPPVDPTSDDYMNLYYSLDFQRVPRVAIVPSPDAYDLTKRHIVSVQEGVLMWTLDMEQKYGGDWSVTFDIIKPGDRFKSKPDVIMNLITPDQDQRCYDKWLGWAYINGKKPLQTNVCSKIGTEVRSHIDVGATAAHEFIHAVGLGHTFNKKGDLMCSTENGRPTCPGTYSKSKTPSNLNLAAVAEIYGADGFKNPNNIINRNEKFLLDKSNNRNEATTVNNPSKSKLVKDCPNGGYTYKQFVDKQLKSGWYVFYTLCNKGLVNYSFSTDNKNDGFNIYVLPPHTDVKKFVQNGIGNYYTCEDPKKTWHKKSTTCNPDLGSKLILHNKESNTINIEGEIYAR